METETEEHLTKEEPMQTPSAVSTFCTDLHIIFNYTLKNAPRWRIAAFDLFALLPEL